MYWHCELCDSYFENTQLLDEHRIVIHGIQVEADVPDSSEFVQDEQNKILERAKSSETKSNRVHCCACKRITEESNMTVLESSEDDICANCQICGALLERKAMINHLTDHSKSFKCGKCLLTFESPSAVMEHHYAHWVKNEISCDFCSKSTVSNISDVQYHNHLKIIELFHCCWCKKEFRSVGHRAASLTSHLKSHLNETRKEVLMRVVNSSGKNYLCFVCSGRFKNDKDLVEYLSNDRKGSFLCEICGLVFHHQFQKLHGLMHAGIKPWLCDTCGLTFYSSSSLRCHLRVHSYAVPHKCSVCNKGYKSESRLKNHMQRHGGDKPFSCPYCQKAFFNRHALKRHFLVHSNERRYPCKFCGKRFKTGPTARLHLRQHTNEKPYKCERCGKAFAHKVSLVKYHSCSEERLCLYYEKNFKLKRCFVLLVPLELEKDSPWSVKG